MATMELDDPTGYGRVVRDKHGNVESVVETKAEGDATPEQLAIREVNTGVFAFDGGACSQALEQIDTDNAQGEHYLPDVLPMLHRGRQDRRGARGQRPHAHARRQRPRRPAAVRKLAQQRIHDRACAQRRDDRRPRQHVDRRRRDDRPGHGGRAEHDPQGARRSARTARSARTRR